MKRYEGKQTLVRLKQRMQEPEAQRIYRLREQTLELGNAGLKEHRGRRIFRGFGRKRTRAQAGLVILAGNGGPYNKSGGKRAGEGLGGHTR